MNGPMTLIQNQHGQTILRVDEQGVEMLVDGKPLLVVPDHWQAVYPQWIAAMRAVRNPATPDGTEAE